MSAIGEEAIPRTEASAPPRSASLLRFWPLKALLLSPLYPTAFQVVGVAFLGLILYFAFFGTLRAAQNFATTVTWILWWALLPWTFLFAARAWCGVCPVGALGEWAQGLPMPGRRLPGAFLKRYGVWLMALTFVLLTWADRIWNVVGSPRATGLLLGAVLLGALALGLLYQRRAWCRYLCPIGAFSGLYSMASWLEVRARTEGCRACRTKDCYAGNTQAAGCPFYQFPPAMDSNRNCNLCANCLKSCPQGATDLFLRPPGREIWSLRRPLYGEAFLSILLVAVVYLQTIDMTLAFPAYMKWLIEETPIASYNWGITVTFAGVIILVFSLYSLVAWLAGRAAGGGFALGFSRFGYAYIFLALAGHLAHNFSHLLKEGPSALQAALEQLGLKVALPTELALDPSLLTAISLGMVLLGVGGGWYALARLVGGRPGKGWQATLPHMVLLAVLAALYINMFLLPMNPRHSH